MCGIIGRVGFPTEMGELLLACLKPLEYRGYDSAGTCWPSPANKLIVCKTKGPPENLAAKFAKIVPENKISEIGIGHTRWATHGEPGESNAHPHLSQNGLWAVAHNGIITNYMTLKQLLQNKGFIFRSETDTEVIAHLLQECHQNSNALETMKKVIGLLEGTFALAVIYVGEPEKIFFARHGSPLLIGPGEQEYFLASSAAAFRHRTDQAITLNHGEFGFLSRENYLILNQDQETITPTVDTLAWNIEAIQKGGFPYFMEKEIHEQPEVLERVMAGRLQENGQVKLGGLEEVSDILRQTQALIITAAGTSLHAGQIGAVLFQELAKVFAVPLNASELGHQKFPIFPPHSTGLAISQSGETRDLLLAMENMHRHNLPILGICNTVGSSVEKVTRAGVHLNAGPEIGVASTKAFTSQVLTLHLLSLYLRQTRGIPPTTWMPKYFEDLAKIPEQIRSILGQKDELRKIAEIYKEFPNFLVLGRGINFPTACEGALKIKEISYQHAEGYASGEMKHGPLALIDKGFPSIFLLPDADDHYEHIVGNIQEIKARGGLVMVIATEGNENIDSLADHVIYVPPTTYYLTPLLLIVPLQLLAYYLAVALGHDPDKPRNLAKSVTV